MRTFVSILSPKIKSPVCRTVPKNAMVQRVWHEILLPTVVLSQGIIFVCMLAKSQCSELIISDADFFA